MDYNNDGTFDFISGSYDPGDIYLFRGLGKGKYAAGESILDENEVPLVHHPIQLAKYNALESDVDRQSEEATQDRVASFGSWPAPIDWDADGDLDILIGSFGGSLFLRENIGTRSEPKFSGDSKQIEVDGEPFKVSCHACPVVADWDGDGLWDLVVSCGQGSVAWYRNIGKSGEPKFGSRNELIAEVAEQKFLEQNLKPGEAPIPAVRAQICVTDYNRDGQLDLIVGDYSDINWTKELSEEEQAEFDALTEEIKKVIAPMEAIQRVMYDKDTDEETKKEKLKEQQAIMSEYMKLDAEKKSFFKDSRSASFIWLYLRKPKKTDSDSSVESGAYSSRSNSENDSAQQKLDAAAIAAAASHSDKPVEIDASVVAIEGSDKANFEVTVRLAIQPGWHVYASVPKGYPSPIADVEMDFPKSVKPIGTWNRPFGVPDSKNPKLTVYRRSVEFTQKLLIPEGFEKSQVDVKVHYQVCDENSCLPPATFKATVNLPSVKADKSN